MTTVQPLPAILSVFKNYLLKFLVMLTIVCTLGIVLTGLLVIKVNDRGGVFMTITHIPSVCTVPVFIYP